MVLVPALAGIGEFAAFLVALIAIYAAYLLTQLLLALFQYVPLVGGWIRDNLLSHVADALSSATSWAVAGLGHGVGLIWTPITWMAAMLSRIGEALWSGLQAAERIVTTTIPNAMSRVADFATQLYHQAVSYADGVRSAVSAYAQSLYNAAVGFAQSLYAAAVGFAQSLYNAAVALTHQLYVAATTLAVALYHQAVAFTTATAAGLSTWVQGLFHSMTAWVEARFAQEQAWVQQEVGALETDVQNAYHAATGYAQAAAAAAEATALGAVAVEALRLTRYLEQCGTNLCKGLNPLSTLMQELGGLVEGGVIFALVAAAAADPVGTAHEVDQVIGGTVAEAGSVLRSAVGLG
ncbi:MAG TPA: hypothetical protein VHQ90_00115 [Thermoanaerobaculia bacterium]|nr:hypothetical protein [Thermoanaerobaculia bacterium]